MRDLKWYYLLGIVIGLIALGAVVYWLVRTGGLLTRLTALTAKKTEAIEPTD